VAATRVFFGSRLPSPGGCLRARATAFSLFVRRCTLPLGSRATPRSHCCHSILDADTFLHCAVTCGTHTRCSLLCQQHGHCVALRTRTAAAERAFVSIASSIPFVAPLCAHPFISATPHTHTLTLPHLHTTHAHSHPHTWFPLCQLPTPTPSTLFCHTHTHTTHTHTFATHTCHTHPTHMPNTPLVFALHTAHIHTLCCTHRQACLPFSFYANATYAVQTGRKRHIRRRSCYPQCTAHAQAAGAHCDAALLYPPSCFPSCCHPFSSGEGRQKERPVLY